VTDLGGLSLVTEFYYACARGRPEGPGDSCPPGMSEPMIDGSWWINSLLPHPSDRRTEVCV